MTSLPMGTNYERLEEVERKLNQMAAAGDRVGVANLVRELEGTEFQDGLVVESARFWLAQTKSS